MTSGYLLPYSRRDPTPKAVFVSSMPAAKFDFSLILLKLKPAWYAANNESRWIVLLNLSRQVRISKEVKGDGWCHI